MLVSYFDYFSKLLIPGTEFFGVQSQRNEGNRKPESSGLLCVGFSHDSILQTTGRATWLFSDL